MNHEEFYAVLAKQGIRMFALSLGVEDDPLYLIHPQKTVQEWREDVRRFISEIGQNEDSVGDADFEVFDELSNKLHEAGYLAVDDMVADVYEGRIAKYKAGIEDDPSDEEQISGFGQYGFESKE